MTKNQKSSIIIIEIGKNNNRKQNKKIKKFLKKVLTSFWFGCIIISELRKKGIDKNEKSKSFKN